MMGAIRVTRKHFLVYAIRMSTPPPPPPPPSSHGHARSIFPSLSPRSSITHHQVRKYCHSGLQTFKLSFHETHLHGLRVLDCSKQACVYLLWPLTVRLSQSGQQHASQCGVLHRAHELGHQQDQLGLQLPRKLCSAVHDERSQQ